MVRVIDGSRGNVPIVTVDSEVQKCSVGVIKMDIEGHELRALRGMEETIERCSPIFLCEVLHTQSSKLRRAFEDLGYNGFKLFRSDWLFYRDKI